MDPHCTPLANGILFSQARCVIQEMPSWAVRAVTCASVLAIAAGANLVPVSCGYATATPALTVPADSGLSFQLADAATNGVFLMRSKASLDACDFSGAVELPRNATRGAAHADWRPDAPGEYGFACGAAEGAHCMRLAVTVVAAGLRLAPAPQDFMSPAGVAGVVLASCAATTLVLGVVYYVTRRATRVAGQQPQVQLVGPGAQQQRPNFKIHRLGRI